jgi:hypothetical protein
MANDGASQKGSVSQLCLSACISPSIQSYRANKRKPSSLLEGLLTFFLNPSILSPQLTANLKESLQGVPADIIPSSHLWNTSSLMMWEPAERRPR